MPHTRPVGYRSAFVRDQPERIKKPLLARLLTEQVGLTTLDRNRPRQLPSWIRQPTTHASSSPGKSEGFLTY